MGYGLVDADNHYYESEDCFTRHGDEEIQRFVKWYSQGKKRFVAFGQTFQTMVPKPTFNPVTKPGIMHKRLKELAEGGERRNLDNNESLRWGGQIEPLSEHYQDRDARLRVMDEQGVDKVWMFPTLAVGVEGLNPAMVQMTYKLFHSFNRWLEEDWGWNYEDRIISAAAIPVLDPVEATKELEAVLDRGARLIVLRPGPANGRSPADLSWDPFWSRVQEADVPVTYHVHGGGDAYDDAFRLLWQRNGVSDRVYDQALRTTLFGGDRTILDTVAALVLGNLFGRFPKLRIATIELGCAWVPYCLHMLDHAGLSITDRYIEAFGQKSAERPSEIFKRHFWVSPFPEEDVIGLTSLIGVDHVLFGSDWPHSEGTEQPGDYVRYIKALDDGDRRKVLRENALSLLAPSP
ncbi:MAG TPA: amidohydrolase family protein [Acidimicrobiales bacterium]|nr:amidohydrolase family protein [Acidimicrobiales bacterium]